MVDHHVGGLTVGPRREGCQKGFPSKPMVLKGRGSGVCQGKRRTGLL